MAPRRLLRPIGRFRAGGGRPRPQVILPACSGVSRIVARHLQVASRLPPGRTGCLCPLRPGSREEADRASAQGTQRNRECEKGCAPRLLHGSGEPHPISPRNEKKPEALRLRLLSRGNLGSRPAFSRASSQCGRNRSDRKDRPRRPSPPWAHRSTAPRDGSTRESRA